MKHQLQTIREALELATDGPIVDRDGLMREALTALSELERMAGEQAPCVESEREVLRAAQAKAVMPLVGPLLDAWESCAQDVRDQHPELDKQLRQIDRAMQAAPPAQQPHKPLFAGLIAQHPGLREELNAVDDQPQAVCLKHGECFGGECVYRDQQPQAVTPQASTIEDAARDVGKWLNERPNRPIDLRHVAMLVTHAQQPQADRSGCTAGSDEECTNRRCATSCPALKQPQYEAADMASAAAQGFRDGVASVAQQPQYETDEAIAADAYVLACQELERWQHERRKAGKDAGTTGSLVDGIAWLYGYIDDLEAKQPQAEVVRGKPVRVCHIKDVACSEAAVKCGECPDAAPQQAEAVPEVRSLLDRHERAWHRMGELWERCQGKSWPEAESNEFTRLRDELAPAIRKQLVAQAAPQQAELDDHLKLHAVEELCQLGYTVKDGELFPPDHLHKLMEAAQHPLSSPQQAEAVPSGFVLVPLEPTEAMHVAAVKTIQRCTGNDDFPPAVWAAMIAAAQGEKP